MFVIAEENKYVPQKNIKGKVVEDLPSGIYGIKDISGPFQPTTLMFSKQNVTNELIVFKSGVIGDVINKIDTFFTPDMVQKYKAVNLRHKEGIILYGKPGTGKTAAIMIAMQQIAKQHSVLCLDFSESKNFGLLKYTLETLNDINPHIKKVVFIDECEKMLNNYEDDFLYALDGAEYMESVMFIGCTNKFQDIPHRLLRPSRIGTHIQINSISKELAQEYLSTKYGAYIPVAVQDMLSYYSQENNMTVDQFKDVCKNVYLQYDLYNQSDLVLGDISKFVEKFKYDY